MNTRTFRLPVSILAGAALLATPALADDGEGEVPNSLSAINACRTIEADSERLACYDREVTSFTRAAQEGEVRVVDREDAKKARRSLFGFSLPFKDIFGGDDKEDVQQTLVSTVTSVRPLRGGEYQFRIEEGDAVWETTNSPARLRAPQVGDKVEFKKALFNSYWISFDGQIGVKGKRVG